MNFTLAALIFSVFITVLSKRELVIEENIILKN